MISKILTTLNRYWWAILILVVAAWLVYVGVNCHLWPNSNCTGFQGKTIWDVLELLIIPATLAGVAVYLDNLERNTDREIAKDNQQEIALQNYFDAITSLLLHENLSESGNLNNPVRNIAQVKTISTLERLDISRKAKLIVFLTDIGLVNSLDNSDPIINLKGAYLNGIYLATPDFIITSQEEDISINENQKISYQNGINLQRANLTRANLKHAFLAGAHLENAVMYRTRLKKAILLGAHLEGTNLEKSYLEDTELLNATYDKNTRWPAGFDPVAAGAVLVE